LLKKNENPNKFLKNIFKQTLLGISYLHSKNVIHRNLRMKKILLLDESIFEIEKNVIKIIDFSLAQFGD
jgi:serine/threonine protein kinase